MEKLIMILKKIKRSVLAPASSISLPDPNEYSTLDNPLEVPRQKEAYYYILNKIMAPGDKVLDVGFGLGYGINILSILAGEVTGAEVDTRAVDNAKQELLGRNPKLKAVQSYDGNTLPYEDKSFDVVCSVDVLEHVEEYDSFIDELLRLAKKALIFATPLRRPEYTNPDGTPMNYYHLREWSHSELDKILKKHSARLEWKFINGQPDGPYTITDAEKPDSLVLMPILWI